MACFEVASTGLIFFGDALTLMLSCLAALGSQSSQDVIKGRPEMNAC